VQDGAQRDHEQAEVAPNSDRKSSSRRDSSARIPATTSSASTIETAAHAGGRLGVRQAGAEEPEEEQRDKRLRGAGDEPQIVDHRASA
jgi:hypothetical protein